MWPFQPPSSPTHSLTLHIPSLTASARVTTMAKSTVMKRGRQAPLTNHLQPVCQSVVMLHLPGSVSQSINCQRRKTMPFNIFFISFSFLFSSFSIEQYIRLGGVGCGGGGRRRGHVLVDDDPWLSLAFSYAEASYHQCLPALLCFACLPACLSAYLPACLVAEAAEVTGLLAGSTHDSKPQYESITFLVMIQKKGNKNKITHRVRSP